MKAIIVHAIAAFFASHKHILGNEPVEDFVSGLLFELLGKDLEPDIKNCLNNESGLEKEIEEAIADFKKGDLNDIVKGVLEIGEIIKELPEDLAECKEIDKDLIEIAKWAAKFKNPVTLAVTIAKNLLFHWKGIENEVKKLEKDWGTDYYAAGVDVGDIVISALGKPTFKDIFAHGSFKAENEDENMFLF